MSDYELPDRERNILETVKQFSRKVPRKNLTTVDHSYAVRKSSLVLMLIPEWANMFPPYNLARLSAITKNAGYKTTVIDLNTIAANSYNEWGIDWNPWQPGYMPRWCGAQYSEWVHPHIEPLLLEWVDKVAEMNPTVVGFTLYNCNTEPTKFFIEKLREKLPNVVIIGGGGLSNTSAFTDGEKNVSGAKGAVINHFDFLVSGEGEQLILDVMERIENGDIPDTPELVVQNLNERIDLDEVPIPDYEDFDLNSYEIPDMVAMELSRGCIAKCTFCDETHYWKYRDRIADRVLKEILYLTEKGIRHVWFIDSLVNGNIKEFRAILKGIIALGLPEKGFKWAGQARVDGRMDLEYFKDIADSGGGMALSFGVESGSNKVLEDMKKGITRDEIEQNYKDAAANDISVGVMLIPGFPTELPQDFYETLMLLWRIRNYGVSYITPGIIGCIITPDTALGTQPEKFGISFAQLGHSWSTKNLLNTKVHRLIRLKCINIFLEHLINDRNQDHTYRKIKNYTLEFEDPSRQNHIEYEEIDFLKFFGTRGDDPKNNFVDSIFSEIVVLARVFWKTRGAFSLHVNFEENYDTSEFTGYLGCNFNADFYFKIDSAGNYTSSFEINFIQDDSTVWRMNTYETEVDPAKPLSRAKQNVLRVINIDTTGNDDKWEIWNKHSILDMSFHEKRTASGKWQAQLAIPEET